MNATGVADDAASSNLKIFRGGGAIGEYASSPFVTKVEMRLRLAGQTYSVDDGEHMIFPLCPCKASERSYLYAINNISR